MRAGKTRGTGGGTAEDRNIPFLIVAAPVAHAGHPPIATLILLERGEIGFRQRSAAHHATVNHFREERVAFGDHRSTSPWFRIRWFGCSRRCEPSGNDSFIRTF